MFALLDPVVDMSNGGWNQSDSNRHYSYSLSEHRH